MTLEEFRHIKNKLFEILNKYNIYVEKNKNDLYTPEGESFEENIINEYISVQNELLSKDLSLIPFEEWQGMTIISESLLDFSKTHANIDFSLLKEFTYETINLKGCNIRGLEYLDYNEDTFDDEFKLNYPDYFPDKTLPKEIQNNFYEKKLEFKDLIEYPLLRKCINKFSFKKVFGSTTNILIEKIGFINAIKLFDEYPVFITTITSNELYFGQYIRNAICDKQGTYEQAKECVFNIVLEYLKKDNQEILRRNIPEEMKEKHPEAFLKAEELNDPHGEEIAKLFNEGRMPFGALRKYRDILKNKIVEIGITNKNGIKIINEICGNIWNFLDSIPKELDYIVANYFRNIYLDNDLEYVKKLSIDQIIKNAIVKELNESYSNCRLEMINIYSNYLEFHEIIKDEKLLNFIKIFGIDRLVKFNEKHNFILNEHDKFNTSFNDMLITYLAKYSNEYENIDITDDNIYEIINNIIKKMKSSKDYNVIKILKICSKKLSKEFPDIFIDYEIINELLKNEPEEKRQQIISNLEKDITSLLIELRKMPELLKALKGKNLMNSNFDIEIQNFYYEIGNDKFLEIGTKYGEGLAYLIRNLKMVEILKLAKQLQATEEFESIINEYFFNLISNNRKFDIRCLSDSFKEQHPELYLSIDAPELLKRKFYGTDTSILGTFDIINISNLPDHPEWFSYLLHIDLEKCLTEKKVNAICYNEKLKINIEEFTSFYKALLKVFTKEETLKILFDYGKQLYEIQNLNIDTTKTKEEIYNNLLNLIYLNIKLRKVNFNDKMPVEFKEKYPDIFLDKNLNDYQLERLFYNKGIDAKSIQEHPEWIKILEKKNIEVVCNNELSYHVKILKDAGICNFKILDIIYVYGKYLSYDTIKLSTINKYKLNEFGYDANGENILENLIQSEIIYAITQHCKPYEEDLKPYIVDKVPRLFLSDDAPTELKKYYYNDGFNFPLTFQVLKEHPEWIPYLKEKNVLLSLKKQNIGVRGLEEMFEYFGSDEALRIGIKNPEAVMKMLETNKFDLLKKWYEKLNFIPHHVVMLEFSIEEADKFISSGKKWSQLMKLEKYNLNEESKSALLKACMCFGVFDGDNLGYNKIIELFTGIPNKLTEEEIEKIKDNINKELIIIPYPNDDKLTSDEKQKLVENSIDKIKENNLKTVDEVYRKKEDGKYHMIASYQSDKRKIEYVKDIIETLQLDSILTPDKAHKLFGGFEMEYQEDFRDFLLQNIETILTSDEYIAFISAIQKQWKQIKIFNSNRKLTLDLALAFVKNNTYENIEVGNENLARVSNQAGYSQKDFETLQIIYNYGKTRVFSSIPRISQKQDCYNYEILRLDDPLALAIGTLTDCCQELGNAAEMCVEHSMVSIHGRIFVIRDEEGNIIAQSWVWRNQNVLCFDNIEIPAKAFSRAEKQEITRETFAEIIYNLYKQAAEELIEKDNYNYKLLLESKKISLEQYESLKLAKVTVGLGFNDIREAIKAKAKEDENKPTMPIEFTPVVELIHGLYTNDSRTQYILAGEENTPITNEKTLSIYQDEYKILDDSNINEIDALILQKLEYKTYNNSYYLHTQVNEKNNVVSQIAYNYNLNPSTTKIIMNSNLAIIYDIKENEIVIGDILYNETEIISNFILKMQLRIAIDQIKEENKIFNTNNLIDKQIMLFDDVLSLGKELDEERGLTSERV